MKLLKPDLLTLLISLFILGSCKTSDQIGLDPANTINGTLIEEAVKTTTVAENPFITNSLSKFPAGYLEDPVFGATTANLAMSLNLPTADLTFGTSPQLDSAVLVLKYYDGYYGDANANLTFEVHQLNERLQPGKAYYNTESQGFNPSPIGSKSVKVNTKDSVRVTEIVKGGPNVEKNKAPQIRITLDPTFVNNNFLGAAPANFATNNAFNNSIKGLYVKVNGITGTTGGIAFFDLNSTDGSKLELYYKNGVGTATFDTTVVSFPIQSSLGPVAAEFKHDYANTPVQTQLNNPATEDDVTYVQPMAGVKTQVNFPNLEKLGKITVNKAELIVSVDPVTVAAPFTAAPRLFLYRSDIAGQRQWVPDVSNNDFRTLTDADFGGFYDSSKNQYKFVITSYIQDILSGKLKQYNTYISAVDPLANRLTALSPSGTTAARAIIGSGKSTAAYKMKLNIIYTKAN